MTTNVLHQFLHTFRTSGTNETKEPLSHVSLFTPKGRFSVQVDMMDQFWSLYQDHYQHSVLGIAEMTGLHLPVLVDVDIKKEVEAVNGEHTVEELYDTVFVERLVKIYQKVLRDIVSPLRDDFLLCCYMSKKPYLVEKNGKTCVKHGFHLHFPYIFLHRYAQENELLPRIRLELKKMNTDLPVPVDQAIDKTYCRGNTSPWLLYGGRKDPTMDSYMIDSIFLSDGSRVFEWRSYLLSYKLYNEHPDTAYQSIPLTMDTLDTFLPRILSTRPQGRSTDYILDLRDDLVPIRDILPQKRQAPVVCGTQSSSVVSVISSDDLLHHNDPNTQKTIKTTDVVSWTRQRLNQKKEIVRELLSILNVSRSDDRNDWIYVGWVLYNIFKGSDDGLDLWMMFSQKSPDHYDEAACRYEWTRMTRKNMTIGSLKHLARLDSPEQYTEITTRMARPFMDKAFQLCGTHHDIALALYQKYDHEFVCGSIRDKIWHTFVSPIWVRNEDGVGLRSKISGEFVVEYEKIHREWMVKASETDDKDEQKYMRKKGEQIMRLISHLKTAPFKNNVMKECSEVFYDPHFIQKLDSDPFIIAFQNGVFHLSDMVFRDGRPSDRISMCMPIKYRQDLSHNDPEVRAVFDFLEKIFPDRSVRDYFLNISCEVFVGGNTNKIVQFWSGDGDNGKSVTQSLFEKMLGPYSIKLPTSLLVGKRTQSSSACPELVRAGNGVRMAMLQEPDQKDVINIGILKELSGNDSFFARGLYKEGSEIQPMFKLVLVCNEPPKLPYSDKATWNRIRVIPFESTFTDTPPATFEEQLEQKRFPKDKFFMKKIPQMAEAFAWILLEHLKTRPSQRVEPEKVKMATHNYQKKNDIFRQFIDENVVADDEKSCVRLQQLYSRFKEWYREGFPQDRIPGKTEVRENMIKIWGEPKTGGSRGLRWDGYSLVADVSDEFGATQESLFET